MRREKLLRKAISECKDYPTLPESVRNTCKKHDLKLAWLDKPISWLPYQVTAISDRYVTTTNNVYLKSDFKKDGKPIPQGNAAIKKLILPKTREIRRSFSENFKLRTIAKSTRNLNGTTSEEIIEEQRLTVVSLNADEYMYRPNAPNTRRKAICDEIEKCIVQTGGTLRSLRRDLIVDVNLSNWYLL